MQPFLRISTQQDNTQTVGLSYKPFELLRDLYVSPSGAVLIYGQGVPNKGTISPPCVYLVDKSLEVPDRRTLAAIIMEAFQDYEVYYTTRDNRTVCITKNADVFWKLENVYGRHFSEMQDQSPGYYHHLSRKI